jgi:hypothetical protein
MRVKLSIALGALCAVLCLPAPAHAQLNSNEATVTLSADLLESLSVVVLPGLVNFNLTSGSATNPGSTAVVVTTSWAFTLTRTSVKLYAYFTSASAALVHTQPGNTVDIPSSRFHVAVNGGAAQALNQTVAFGGASAGVQLYNQPLTILNISGSRADTLTFNIDLSSYVLPVDTYTGTLRLRAQATP